MNNSGLKSKILIQSVISVLCFFIILSGKNDLLEEQYPNWMMMLWAITLFSPLAYKYHVNSGKAVNFKNMFGLSFSFQVILVIIHLLLYNHFSSLKGDSIFGGCSDCGPTPYFWISASANILMVFLTYKWKKIDFGDQKEVATESEEPKDENQ